MIESTTGQINDQELDLVDFDDTHGIQEQKKKKQKHNYTSELELKSLLIRIKNNRLYNDDFIGENDADLKYNTRINKYIKLHTLLNSTKYDNPRVISKRNRIKSILKERVIRDSERTIIDNSSYERFGKIILLMVKNILKKPQFSGYTYKDDFYSDAIYKILKYLDNFDHTLISERTGTPVNSFAYISQIIHNSILFIINTKKKENDRLKNQLNMELLNHNFQIDFQMQNIDNFESKQSKFNVEFNNTDLSEEHDLNFELISKDVQNNHDFNLVNELRELHEYIKQIDTKMIRRINVFYPKSYSITFDEYDLIKPYLNSKISITRSNHDDKTNQGN